jgi:DNA-binding response OmpR family regulator
MSGASLFLVEDEALIRMMIADMIVEFGHRVVAEAGNIDEATALAGSAQFDLALLDVNIVGSNVSPAAEIIERRGLPLLFVTGYRQNSIPPHFQDRPILSKPFLADQLKAKIDAVLSAVRNVDAP